MKILFVNGLYEPYVGGGAEIILHKLTRGLMGLGHQVVVLSIGKNPDLSVDRVDGVKVYRAGIRNLYFPYGQTTPSSLSRTLWHLFDCYNPLMQDYVRHVVAAEKPEVASCHNLAGWSVSVWDALTEAGVPIVQVLHDQYLLCPTSTMFDGHAPCARQCLRCRALRIPHAGKSNQVSAVVGVSRFILDKLLSYGYFRDTKTRQVIYDARALEVEYRKSGAASVDGLHVFGYIGTLAPHKGIEMLLDAFSRPGEGGWRLVIAGIGKHDYEAELKKRYRNENIFFAGYLNPKEFFEKIDVCIVPSLWEDTFPGVVLESLSMGVPVIGSARGGIPEMLVHGYNGMLFNPEDPNGLFSAMRNISESLDGWRAKRESIVNSAPSFSDGYGWSKQWEALYASVV
ncbi:glycosyltransferase family 4 protein [Chlorobium sp. N1]|uniref:glycosyltransferase family 4 protein n=1 Tax=Chlorobium sp. N1 TaxID=2491138 RepID=UPI00103B392C|nr:glycosyltransferase family 4 protein [Chlorobium sp. N1]TCD47276.1 glycosyltransferase [Chlorobium sp. N1]